MVSPAIVAKLQQAAASGEQGALLGSLRDVLADEPELVATPSAAATLAKVAASLAARFPKPDYGAISSAISGAAPASTREQVIGAVTDAVVGVAVNGPDERLLATGVSSPGSAPATTNAGAGTPTPVAGVAQVRTPPPVKTAAEEQAPTFPATEGAPAYSDQVVKRLVKEETKPLRSQPLKPYKLGSFFVYPRLVQSEVYDDNIFATRTQRKEDLISVVSPSLRLESDWARNVLNFEAGADAGFYSSFDSENYLDYHASGEGRYDISTHSNVFGGLRFQHSHEDRESPDEVFGTEPTTYDDLYGYGGVFHRLDKLSMRVGGTVQRLNYNNVPSPLFGTIDNDDRDRNLYTGGVWLGYQLTPHWQPFAQGAFDLRRYDQRLDENGFHRASEGYRLLAGARMNYPGLVRGELYSGLMRQNYNDSLLPSVTAPALGLNLTWYPAWNTTVTGYVDRTIEETTLAGASSFVDTILGMGFNHQLSDRLLFNVHFAYSNYDYQGIDRTDDLLNAGAGLRYDLARGVFVEGEYRFRHLSSTVPGENFDRNQVFLRLGVEPPVGRFAGVGGGSSSFPESYDPSGFYVGAQGGYGMLNTALHGPRGPSGEASSEDFGGGGGTWGVFGGYGRLFHRWYIGLEGEGGTGKESWQFSRPSVREIKVEKNITYGASARVGHMLGNTTLLYGRLGFVRAQFATDYNFQGTPFLQDNTETGLRVGAGAEIAATRSLFLRFDYTYTDYGSYDVDYLSGIDHFDDSESLFRVGAGFHF